MHYIDIALQSNNLEIQDVPKNSIFRKRTPTKNKPKTIMINLHPNFIKMDFWMEIFYINERLSPQIKLLLKQSREKAQDNSKILNSFIQKLMHSYYYTHVTQQNVSELRTEVITFNHNF